MKKCTYLVLLSILLCNLYGCSTKADNTNPDAEASGNFSTEMHIEESSDVTIVEMP